MATVIGRNTVKAFLRKNAGNIYILVDRRFDGMTDGCERTGQVEFSKAETTERCPNNTMGIKGAWFVCGGRDFIDRYEDNGFVGFSVSNSCGSFKLAVAKEA